MLWVPYVTSQQDSGKYSSCYYNLSYGKATVVTKAQNGHNMFVVAVLVLVVVVVFITIAILKAYKP